MSNTIKKAVIPSAGFGTRMLPITKFMPKEMLPVLDPKTKQLKLIIHFVVEETIKSVIKDILIVTSRGKRAIEDYFDSYPELELYLRENGKAELLEAFK